MEELYKILLEERDKDSKRYWTIFSLMNIINAGLLAAIASRENPDIFLKVLASNFGMILCAIWLFAELRMLSWISLWERKIRDMERCYLKEIHPTSGSEDLYELGFRIFRQRKNPWWAFLPTRWIGPLISVFFGVVWLLIRLPCITKLPILNYLFRS